MKILTLLCLTFLYLTSLLSAQPVAFTHLTLIDATGRPARPDQTVVVTGDRISAIGDSAALKIPKGAKVVDSRGKFMTPGLWDMHVHFRGGPALIPDNESWLALFLAHGITGIREMGGDIPETVFQWRAEIANGSRLGPRILSSGPKLDGPKPIWPGSIPVTDPESARQAVRKVKSMGADLVKIYAPGFPKDTFTALMDEAKQNRIYVAGHLPFNTHTVRESIDAGVHDIQHVEFYVLPGCVRTEKQNAERYAAQKAANPAASTAQLLGPDAEDFDMDLARDLVARLKAHDVWVTPTLAVLRQANTMGRADHTRDPERRYIFPGMWATWDPKDGKRKPPSDADLALYQKVHQRGGELCRLLQDGGVGLLAGSDCGASNNFTYPGWMLDTELVTLVEGGLTPMEALQAATRNPARFLGELESSGTAETGKIANLLLLQANPLEDMGNIRKVDSVVLRGKLLTRADLDRMLAKVAKDAAR